MSIIVTCTFKREKASGGVDEQARGKMSQDGSLCLALASPKQHSSPRLFISATAVQILLQSSSYKAVGILFPINPWITPKLSPPSRNSGLSLFPPPSLLPHDLLFRCSTSFLALSVQVLCLLDFGSAFSLDALPFLCSWQTFLKPFSMSLHCHPSLTRRFCLSSTRTGESVLSSLLPSLAHPGESLTVSLPHFRHLQLCLPHRLAGSRPGFSSLHTLLERTCPMPGPGLAVGGGTKTHTSLSLPSEHFEVDAM